MTKAFDLMYAGLQEALAYAEGKADRSKYKVLVPDKIDVKMLRQRLGLTQDEFAQRYFFTSARVKDWEQGRYEPDGATRAYLTVITREPAAVDRALQPPSTGRRISADTVKAGIKRAGAKKNGLAEDKARAKKRA